MLRRAWYLHVTLNQELANHSPTDKVLLEHSHGHSFMYSLWLFLCYSKQQKPHGPQCLESLALYREILPAFALCFSGTFPGTSHFAFYTNPLNLVLYCPEQVTWP